MVRRSCGSTPGSRAPKRSASTIEPRFGCEVSPLMASIAPSTASAPAATAASTLAAAMPLVSWGMEVHRQADLVLERLDQLVGGARPAQARHVLDAEHVGAGGLQFAREPEVVREGVLLLRRVTEVAGVTDRRLAQLAA